MANEWKPKDTSSGLLPPWKKSKTNVIPYYYPEKPLGSRCLWTCKWVFPDNQIRHLKPGGQPSPQELAVELADLLYQGIPDHFRKWLALAYVSLRENGNLGKYTAKYKEVIRELKENHLPEFVANWQPDIDFKKVHSLAVRPGWELTDAQMTAWEVAKSIKSEEFFATPGTPVNL